MINKNNYPNMTKKNARDLKEAGIRTDLDLANVRYDEDKQKEVSIKADLHGGEIGIWSVVAEKLIKNQSAGIDDKKESKTGWVGDHPSGILEQKDYREWVHDHVSKSILARVFAWVSLIGFSGLLVLGGIFLKYHNTIVDNNRLSIEEKLDKKLSIFKTELKSDLKDQTLGTVVATLTEYSDLKGKIEQLTSDEVQKYTETLKSDGRFIALAKEAVARELTDEKLENLVSSILTEKRINEMIESVLASPKQEGRIVASAVKALEGKQGVEKILNGLVSQLEPVIGDARRTNTQRRNALLLLTIFSNDTGNLNNTLRKIITKKEQYPNDVYKDALLAYRPSDTVEVERNFIVNVLNDTSKQKQEEGFSSAYSGFISNFPAAPYAKDIGVWIEKNSSTGVGTLDATINGLLKMGGNDKLILTVLIDMVSKEDQNVRNIGIQAIGDFNAGSRLSDDVRRKQIIGYWRSINKFAFDEKGDSKKVLPAELLADLFQVIKTMDPNTSRLYLESISKNVDSDTSGTLKALMLAPGLLELIGMTSDTADDLKFLFQDFESTVQYNRDALASLLKSNDAEWVINTLWKSKADFKIHRNYLDDLLYVIVKKLFEDNTISKDLLDANLEMIYRNCLELKDALYYTGSTYVFEKFLLNGTTYEKSEFLEIFPDLYHGERLEKDRLRFQGNSLLVKIISSPEWTDQTKKMRQGYISKMTNEPKKFEPLCKSLAVQLARGNEKNIEMLEIAIQLDPNNGQNLFKMSQYQLDNGDFEKSKKYLVGAIKNDADIDNHTFFEYLTRGNEELALTIVDYFTAKYPDNEYNKAGMQENLGIHYVLNKNWQKAFDNTTKVNLVDKDLKWNLLIRSLSAFHLGNMDESQTAYKKWIDLGGQDDRSLWKYIGKELDEFMDNRTKQ